jgi:hypothetical protein
LRLQISEHLPITDFDLGENFIGSCKQPPDNLSHHALQGVKLAPQLLYGSLAFFKATVEIAHKSLTCFLHKLLKQAA